MRQKIIALINALINQLGERGATAYAPIPTNHPLLLRSRSLHRRQISYLLSWYDEISSGTLFFLILLATWPILPHYPIFILWPFLYAILALTRLALHHHKRARGMLLATPRWRWLPAFAGDWLSALARVLGDTSGSISARQRIEERQRAPGQHQPPEKPHLYLVVMGVYAVAAALFVITVRWASARIGMPIGEDSAVWLIFAPVIWLIARRESLFWVLGAFGVALVANVVSFVAADLAVGLPVLGDDLRLIAVETAWLIPFCLLPTLLMRSLTDRQADLKDADIWVREIASLHLRVSSERAYANEAVAIMQRLLSSQIPGDAVTGEANVEVSLLLATAKRAAQGQRLQMVGSTSAGGRRLAREGFTLGWDEGITGWAASTRHYKLVNDVETGDPDRHFVANEEAFPHTRAELAIPLMRDDEVIGVLDLESATPNVFDEDLVFFLGFITPHLAIALDDARTQTRIQGLTNISHVVARHLLAQGDQRAILDDIANIAYSTLQANSVIAVPRDVVTGVFGDPIFAPDHPALGVQARAKGQDKVTRLVAALLRSSRFMATLQEGKPVLLPAVQPAEPPTPAERPKAAALLLIPLMAGATDANERAGDGSDLLALYGFLLVHSRRSFLRDDAILGWCAALARIAALALQTAHYTKQALDDRQYMWQEIHDGLSQYASFTRMLLEQAAETYSATHTLSPSDGEKLLLARTISQAMQREVNYLVEAWRAPARSTGLFAELRAYAAIVAQTLEITCTFIPEGGEDSHIAPEVQYQIRLIVREAVHNATRHGRASEITITVGVCEEQRRVSCRIEDNGTGFSVGSVTPRGLASLRQRAGSLGGSLDITNAEPHGTVVSLSLPTQPAHLLPPLLAPPPPARDEAALAALRRVWRQQDTAS